MGASTFSNEIRVTGNESAKQAFQAACQAAQYEYGHGGYTGTIAEKTGFIVTSTAPTWEAARQLADPDADDVSDKWGPAGCIIVKNNGGPVQGYLFYGWASD